MTNCFLCVLAGAKDVVGIENPLEDKDDETVKRSGMKYQ